MASISSLFVELKLSAESFNNGLKEAQREAKEFEKNLKPTLTVTKDLGIAMTAAGAAITAAFGAAAKSAIDYGDKLNDARQRTGATVETLAKLGFAAEQSGSSFEGLSNGVKFLARNMEAAIAKTGDQRAAFNALGISSQQLVSANGDINKTFLLLADRFKELPDGAEKSALAMRVFGKSGADLIPLLNEGSAGIRKLGDDAQKAGLVISQDFASASDELNDTLNEVKASALGASVGIAQALLPALQSAASFAADAGAKFAAFSKEHPALIQATAALGVTLLTVGTSLTAIAVIVPKVQAGFVLLQAGAAALGITITAATAGIVALGAAIGVGIGLLANYILKITDLEKHVDSFVDGALKKMGFEWASTVEQQKSAEFTANAVAKAQQGLNTELNKSVFVGPIYQRVINDGVAAQKTQKKALDESKKAAEDLRSEIIKIQTPIGDWADAVHEYGDEWRRLFDVLKVIPPAINFANRDFRTFTETVNQAIGDLDLLNDSLDGLDQSLRDVLINDPGVKIGGDFGKAKTAAEELKSSFDDVKRTAANVFQEMFRDGEISFTKLGGVLSGVFETAASEILATMTAKLITPLVDKVTGALSSLLGGIPGLGGVFGGAASAAGGAASAGGGAASSAGSLASGATGILGGVIGGGIAAAGSLLGSARLEGTMNAVEFNTRATYIELRDTMDLILQPMKARLEDILAELYNHKYIPDILETIANRIGGAPSGVGTVSTQGGTSISINVFQNAGEDGAGFARRIAEELNRYVQFGGGRLIASGLNA